MRLKGIITTILILSFASAFAQKDGSEYIYMKDGKMLGKRETLVKACVSGMEGKDMNNGEKVCDCMMTLIAKNFTMKEFMKMAQDGKEGMTKIFTNKKKPELTAELIECVGYAFSGEGSDTADIGRSNDFRDSFIQSCVSEFHKKPEMNEYSGDIYCTCFYDKMMEQGLGKNAFKDISDPNSPVVIEIAAPCLIEAKWKEGLKFDDMPVPAKEGEEVADDNTVAAEVISDVIGPVSDSIKLVNIAGVYRVKVTVGTAEKYFTLDSGASDVCINSILEKELLNQGLITKNDYIGEGIYTLADGSKVKARRVFISDLKLGAYTVNNVEAVILSKDSGMLLGKSFLDKFSNWSIDNKTGSLLLTR